MIMFGDMTMSQMFDKYFTFNDEEIKEKNEIVPCSDNVREK